MRQQRIPLLTTEEFSRFPDQTVEILNRLIAEVNQYQADRTEITNAILSLRKQVKNLTPTPTPPTPTGEYQQVLQFVAQNMGNTPGLCLVNCMNGYGIQAAPGRPTNAYEDMLYNKNAGTLHEEVYPPADIQVPIYIRTGTVNQHVVVWDRGVVYSDGTEIQDWISYFGAQNVYGWGELLDTVRVVAPVQ